VGRTEEGTNGNIQSEEGSLKRQIRSVRPEGHYGNIKEEKVPKRIKALKKP